MVENIDGIQDFNEQVATDIVSGLKSKTFVRTDLGEQVDKVPRRLGVLAQDVEALLPPEIHNIVLDDSDGYKSVAYDRLVCILWTAVQNLTARVQALETKNT